VTKAARPKHNLEGAGPSAPGFKSEALFSPTIRLIKTPELLVSSAAAGDCSPRQPVDEVLTAPPRLCTFDRLGNCKEPK
jgi:hypothetical protein